MDFKNFKVNDIIGLVVCDYADGEAIVTGVSKEKLDIQWIYRNRIYSETTFLNLDGKDEILRKDVENGNVFDLELIERHRDKENPWIITEYQIGELIESYNANKEDLEKLGSYIEDNGCTDDGLSDATESFEQGWNNALLHVFNILGVNIC